MGDKTEALLLLLFFCPLIFLLKGFKDFQYFVWPCCRLSPHMRKHNYFPLLPIVKSVFVYVAIAYMRSSET
ncbi:hypothetical protein AAZX31_03G112400 [Glycine max]|uniref:Uncharacterized protein n=2 Tax=Glycine subgen. Soja TaxID=1462606 RepID=K7KEQ0_SOYBN|nr:hypothetical protein JHK87_007178 [Glycine soja]KAG5055046.1 hypothetical protein JHK85_007556 [Glycine max]KAG5072127.1 hypothetical protein JHK86_007338 [Glycine max]KAH1069747.1 hypothetical protein GYH30_007075 [Glycine max]RZC20410.1 hypothetical protein D0Y65_007011 [Glycine soja]